MNCIIVDDDIFSSRIMTDYVRRESRLNFLRVFDNAIDAVGFVKVAREPIDIIFLDIEMPEMTGLEFIQTINNSDIQIVICSSQEKYALKSYDYDVCDYLLKPVSYARFLKAIDKAEANIASRNAVGTAENVATNADSAHEDDDKEITVRDKSMDMYKLFYSDVVLLEANENYVCITTSTRKITVHSTMKDVLEMFPEKYVVKVHRSYAVGRRFIQEITSNGIKLLLYDKVVPVGKSFKNDIKNIINEA